MSTSNRTLKKKGDISASPERSAVMERLFAVAELTPYSVSASQRPTR